MEPTTFVPLTLRLKIAAGLFALLLALIFIPAKWVGLNKDVFNKKTTPTNDLSVILAKSIKENVSSGEENAWQQSILGTVVSTTEPLSDADKQALGRLNDSTNLTSTIAKNTVALSVYLPQQGAVSNDVLSSVSQNIADEAEKLASSHTYTLADLNISSDESFSAIKNFGNSLGTITATTLKKEMATDDLSPINSFITNNDSASLEIYKTKISIINSAIASLLKLKTPKSAADIQLGLINYTQKYADVLYSFGKAESDPARALVAVRDYNNTALGVFYYLTQFIHYFDSKNVVFTPKDAGYVFMGGIITK